MPPDFANLPKPRGDLPNFFSGKIRRYGALPNLNSPTNSTTPRQLDRRRDFHTAPGDVTVFKTPDQRWRD